MAQDAGVRSIPELRQFGQNLKAASDALTNLFQQLASQMHRVCDTWNDDKARAFMEDVEKKKSEIDKMSQEMQQFSIFIQHSCEILEQYQNLRR